jgi:RNA polymerase sigma-70 factor (ECF subfamily)
MLAQYGRLVQGVAFHILRSHADAEEVVIDTMVSAWERIGSLREPASLRPWLLRIATRHALSRRRSGRPQQELLVTIDPSSPGPDPERIALGDELNRLPSRMRAALSLHYYAGLTVEETSAALGISSNTVKYHLKTGLVRLRMALDIGAERKWRTERST